MLQEQQLQEFEEQLAKERALREDMERRVATLTAQNETLNDVVYSLSHDLKEPSRNANVALGLLARQLSGKLNQEDHEVLSLAMDSAAKMVRMLEDMLIYCRSDREKGLAEVPVKDLIAVARENLAFQITESGAHIELGNLPVILCRRVPMIQLFQNLIANAIKYRSDARPKISISAQWNGDHWLFSVQDNGQGFAQASAEDVFRLFSQLNQSADGSSSGIGLALCKKIVQSHGGRIWAESKMGKGSIFFFTIPFSSPSPIATFLLPL